MKKGCNQNCGKIATVYAGGKYAGDYAGFFCEPCAKAVGFDVWERHPEGVETNETKENL